MWKSFGLVIFLSFGCLTNQVLAKENAGKAKEQSTITLPATHQQRSTDFRVTIQPQEEPPEIVCIREKGELVVGIYQSDRVPFFMDDEQGKFIGLDIEIAKGLAEALGVKVKFNRISTFDGTVKCVVQRNCDIAISKLSLTQKRANKVLYSNPYVTAHKVLLINRLELEKYKRTGEESIEYIIKTYHPKVAVTRGSSYEDFAQRLIPDAEIVGYDSWEEEAIPKLINGEYFAILDDEFQARKLMEAIPDAPLQLLMVKIKKEFDPIFMILPWSSLHLREVVNRYLEINDIKYDVDKLYEEYSAYLLKDNQKLSTKWMKMKKLKSIKNSQNKMNKD